MNQGKGDIDWEQLHELSGHDQEFEQELLQIFLQDSVEQVLHLQTAWAAGNLGEIRQIAHHIKGASANVGAVVISGWAAQIEMAARDNRGETIGRSLDELSQGVEKLKAYLGQPH